MAAVISECGKYRYWLERGLPNQPYVCWVLANPSTADAELDDPTVRKARGFTSRWGYDRFVFVNLFAGRSTDPKGLLKMEDPMGPENDQYIAKALLGADKIIFAWGNAIAKPLRFRAANTYRLFIKNVTAKPYWCLGFTKDRQPRHPLMLAYTTPLEAYAP